MQTCSLRDATCQDGFPVSGPLGYHEVGPSEVRSQAWGLASCGRASTSQTARVRFSEWTLDFQQQVKHINQISSLELCALDHCLHDNKRGHLRYCAGHAAETPHKCAKRDTA